VGGPAASHATAYTNMVDCLQRVLNAAWHLVDRARTDSHGIERRTSIALVVETDIAHAAPGKNDATPSAKSFYVHTMDSASLEEVARSKKVMLKSCSAMLTEMLDDRTLREGMYAMPQSHWKK